VQGFWCGLLTLARHPELDPVSHEPPYVAMQITSGWYTIDVVLAQVV
jgi:hypothetical protein